MDHLYMNSKTFWLLASQQCMNRPPMKKTVASRSDRRRSAFSVAQLRCARASSVAISELLLVLTLLRVRYLQRAWPSFLFQWSWNKVGLPDHTITLAHRHLALGLLMACAAAQPSPARVLGVWISHIEPVPSSPNANADACRMAGPGYISVVTTESVKYTGTATNHQLDSLAVKDICSNAQCATAN